jgi:hypothetical protein
MTGDAGSRNHITGSENRTAMQTSRQSSRPTGAGARVSGSTPRSPGQAQRLTNQRLDQLSQRARNSARPSAGAQPRLHGREVSYRRPSAGRETVIDDSYRRYQGSRYRCRQGRSEAIIYRDRPGYHRPSHTYDYYDPYRRRCHRIIWPSYSCRIYYPCRTRPLVSCHYPYYHRKYVFVSLGGWWPWDYNCTRYYWYGCHPYRWYGYSPVPYAVGSTYNNYTYNYYGTDNGAQGSAMPGAMTPADPAVDVAGEGKQVPAAGPADHHFSAGVKAFEEGHYAMAAASFQQAMAQAPDDRILPFAYAQALFADGHYQDTVAVLRLALDDADVTDGVPGVFYPRGLYQDDDTLFKHIDQFMDVQEQQPQDADLKLLLGYHLLGIGEVSLARAYLSDAENATENIPAARTLLELADRLEQEVPSSEAG